MSRSLAIKFTFLLFISIGIFPLFGQEDVKLLVDKLKSEPRGPYKDIRWFCDDGRINPAKEPCGENAGVQRARYNDQVYSLAQKKHIFLGQILSGTKNEDFWDAKHDNSRLKQYLIERYLFDNDDGWIQRKSQYYRGATQAEDEEEWGKDFFTDLFDKNKVNEDNYLLIREALKTIPHGGENPSLFRIRALSKDMAELDPKFEDLRIKIHGNPQGNDSIPIKQFKPTKNIQIVEAKRTELLDLMSKYYKSDFSNIIKTRIKKLASYADFKKELNAYVDLNDNTSRYSLYRGIDILSEIKTKIFNTKSSKDKLLLFDISIILEQQIVKNNNFYNFDRHYDIIESACYTGMLSNATGYLNDWEMGELLSGYSFGLDTMITVNRMELVKDNIRRNINWGGSLFLTEFGEDIAKFADFEPMSTGFYDDRVRGSSLLILGKIESSLSEILDNLTNKSQSILGKKMNGIQGLNPGIAKGRIYLGKSENEEIDKTGIYLFQKPPSDLEPVAGILSVSEGNVVSHLQLLARNLGIPNATIDQTMFDFLKKQEGEELFYAVSGNGNVIIKKSNELTNEELALFQVNEIDEDIIEIPIDQIKLDQSKVLNIKDIDATATGIYCGPKAANFAELKKFFPENVVDGLVIPFGVFKSHMLQPIPGKTISYWDYLIDIFNGRPKSESEILTRLDTLRIMIKAMPLKQEFKADLSSSFTSILGKDLGNIPVFLRSDTNMEDLKDFTGAGLNLTVFNVQDIEKIFQGIKDVWASPYSERSYKWRQKFLKNPEHVYPSILVIPSVFVDRSGVIISKNIQTGSVNQLTVAMSRGVGGAVDGQNSETRILSTDLSTKLLAPSRDTKFNTLTPKDGTIIKDCSLSENIISQKDVIEIWKMIIKVYEEVPKTGMAYPYDMEFGFVKDHLWIFQIRPFVENKKASNINYLLKLNGTSKKDLKPINIYAVN
jgi:hypothetical protein